MKVRLAVVALVGLVACGGTSTTPAPPPTTVARPEFPAGSTLAGIQARGRLVAGVKYDQPGLGQRNPATGVVEGFDVEVAKLVALAIFGGSPADVDALLDLREARTPDREALIEAGSVDLVVASYTINDARRGRVDFAGPYLVAGQGILVRLDDQAVNGPADLNGRRVCTARGSTSATNLQRVSPAAEVTLLNAYSECVARLRDGQVDAVTTDDTILAGFVASYPTELKVAGSTFSEEPYGVGLRKGDEALRTFVNGVLTTAVTSGAWTVAFESTLGRIGLATPPPVAVG